MPSRSAGRINAFLSVALLSLICLAVNGYLAYCVTFPPRTLRIRVAIDPQASWAGASQAELKARVESLSEFFNRAAGMRVSVVGFSRVKGISGAKDPELLRRYLEIHIPRDESDVVVAFWNAGPNDQRLGSAVPFTPVGVVRLESGSPERNRAALAHQLGILFGIPESSDSHSMMYSPPGELLMDHASQEYLSETRLFDFSHGLGDLSGRMRGRVLDSLAGQPSAKGKPPRLLLADLLLSEKQFPAAIDQYHAVIASDSKNVPARLGLSQALAGSEQYSDAEAEARAALKMAPNQADTHYQLAYVLVRAGDPEAAISEFHKALAIQPNSAPMHAGLAVAYSASIGEFAASDAEFEVAQKIDPADPLVLADLSYVKRLRARQDRELDLAAAGVRDEPSNGTAHSRLASLLLRQGKVEQSISEAREAIKIGPESWPVHYTLAMGLYANHDLAGASAELARAKKLGSGARPHLEELLRSAVPR